MEKPNSPRLFIKVDADWLARFEAYCLATGQTKSGAVRAALEPAMAAAEKGKLPATQKWGNMNVATKTEVIREHGNDFDKVALAFGAERRAVERFAYRNGLIGPASIAAQ